MIGCLAAVVVLFYTEENWRGKHAWEKYRREREAKGDHFEWSAIAPPPVPDDQNFAMTPLFAELFPKPPEHPRLEAVKLPDCPKAAGNWREGRTENLDAWKTCFTNDNLLAALSKYDPVLREVDEANRRAYCRFPIRYGDNFDALLPHLTYFRKLAQVYRLRALSELATGQTDAALKDVHACLGLAERIKDEPVLISSLVRIAMLDLAIQPVWEGLTAHRWDESQLSVLQAQFEKIDQFESFAKAMQGERLFAYHSIRWTREHPTGLAGWLLGRDLSHIFSRGRASWLDRSIPPGWLYQNQLRVDRFYTETFLPTIDFPHQRISPKAVAAASDSTSVTVKNPYNALSAMFIPALGNATRKHACSQIGAEQAAMACGLERYRLAHGQLPDTLDALVPQFLTNVPHDVIDGQPLRYRRTAPDQFVLYSIGWNERDDGGQIAWTNDKPPRQDQEQGDWVWFSQPQPSASERK